MSEVLLQHDNTRPHTSLKTHEVISSFGWTTISHPHIHQTWHCLTSICLRGWHFSSDEEVKTAVRKWLKIQPENFTMKKYVHSLKGGKRQFGKQKITLKNNYEMLMLYTFLWCTICVPLKLNIMKRNLVALLSEHPCIKHAMNSSI